MSDDHRPDKKSKWLKTEERELVILARYHYSRFQECDWWCLTSSCIGSSDTRRRVAHSSRFNKIARKLGEALTQSAIAPLQEDWDERWHFYETMRDARCPVCGETSPFFDGACTHRLEEWRLLEEKLHAKSRHNYSCWCQWAEDAPAILSNEEEHEVPF
jgi:hypothetical protein